MFQNAIEVAFFFFLLLTWIVLVSFKETYNTCYILSYDENKCRLKHYQEQPPEVFCKTRCLRNFAKFIGKHLCQSLFVNKVAGLRPIKKETQALVFSYEFCEISQNTFFTEHVWATASALRKQFANSLFLQIYLQPYCYRFDTIKENL